MLRATVVAACSLALSLAAGMSGGCGSSSLTPDGGTTTDTAPLVCTVKAPTVCPDPPPHYPDVQPIINRLCVPCHAGLPGGNWPLLQYEHVASWQDLIRAHMLACSMPPPDAGVVMTNDEREAILTWILCGYLE